MEIEHLRDVSIFKDLTDAELEAMTHLWALRVIPAHQRIVAEGEPMHHFHVVRSGLVHVRRLSQKHEVLLARIGRGGFFGEINIFEESTATASIYALDETRIASVENALFRAFLSENPAIGYKVTARLLNELSARLRQTNELLVNSMFWSTSHLK